jgi:hypothetical protein
MSLRCPAGTGLKHRATVTGEVLPPFRREVGGNQNLGNRAAVRGGFETDLFIGATEAAQPIVRCP